MTGCSTSNISKRQQAPLWYIIEVWRCPSPRWHWEVSIGCVFEHMIIFQFFFKLSKVFSTRLCSFFCPCLHLKVMVAYGHGGFLIWHNKFQFYLCFSIARTFHVRIPLIVIVIGVLLNIFYWLLDRQRVLMDWFFLQFLGCLRLMFLRLLFRLVFAFSFHKRFDGFLHCQSNLYLSIFPSF